MPPQLTWPACRRGALLAALLLAGCVDETSVIVTFRGQAARPGDSLCVAVASQGEPAFQGVFSIDEKPLPQTLTVAAGSGTSFTVSAALLRHGQEVARSARRLGFSTDSIGAADVALDGCLPSSEPADYRAVALLGAPTGPGRRLAAGDLDGDGRPDLVVAGPGTLAVLMGRGGGTFVDESQSRLPEGGGTQSPGVVAALDLDGDCRLDLVVGDLEGGVRWLKNLGEGQFGPPQSLAGGGVGALATGDLDGDGNVDLILGGPGGDRALYGPPPFRPVNLDSGDGLAVALVDLDGDEGGLLDLVSLAPGKQPAIRTYLNAGDGGLGSRPLAPTLDEPRGAGAIADLTGDGRADVVTGGQGAPTRILLSQGDGLQVSDARLPENATIIGVADLDGDCRPDVLVGTATGVRLFGNPQGTGDLVERSFPALPPAEAVAFGDFDGDGTTDLALLSAEEGRDTVLLR